MGMALLRCMLGDESVGGRETREKETRANSLSLQAAGHITLWNWIHKDLPRLGMVIS